MNELLINYQLSQNKLWDIDREMASISKLAREYINATDEQRARVDPQNLQRVLDRYNTLKQDRLAAQEELFANELAYNNTLQQAQNTIGAGNGGGQRRRVVPVQEEVIVEEQPVNTNPQMDLYHQNMINNLVQQGRAKNVTNVLSNQNLQPNGTITQSSETMKRNSMPWYQKMVTPYSEGYLRENWIQQSNPIWDLYNAYSNYRRRVWGSYNLTNNW